MHQLKSAQLKLTECGSEIATLRYAATRVSQQKPLLVS